MTRFTAIVALMVVLAGCATVRYVLEQPLDRGRCHGQHNDKGGKHGCR
jgi:hypothetical protein